MNKRIIIIGAGGHGRVIADIVKLSGDEVLGYLDDQKTGEFNGYEILGTTDKVGLADCYYFAAIGNNAARQKMMSKNVLWYTAIHPSAVISDDTEIGVGTAVMANAVINAGSKIGCGVIINTSSTIDHDDVIKDYVHISPGAHLAGEVTVGELTWIGIGASVINSVEISGGVVVGAGAVVVSDIHEKGTYLGVPAKKIR